MNYQELNQLKIDCEIEIDNIEKIERDDNCYSSINNKIALKVVKMSACFEVTDSLEIFDENGNTIAVLVLLDDKDDINVMSVYEEVAAYTDMNNLEDLDLGLISGYYVVVEEEYFEEYLEKYYNSAPSWGGFTHEEIVSPYCIRVPHLVAKESVVYPTIYHKENAIRAVYSDYALDRFLKKYHLLELLFDYDFVESIKNLDTDIRDFGKLISKYSSKELDRLIDTFTLRTASTLDISKLKEVMFNVTHHATLAKKIFQDYSKNGNKIKDDDAFDSIMQLNSFDKDDLKDYVNNINTEEKYQSFLIKQSMYWLYRVRCSIAHNKIGEYIITVNDESFVADFAEPLIDEIIIQCLKQ